MTVTSSTKVVDKPWGYERIIINDSYVMKELFIKAGEEISLQYHEEKHETMYISKGHGIILHDLQWSGYEEGEFYIIPAGSTHKVKAEVDTIIIEASTIELDDIVRIDRRK
jgi:mannose-6-phosphate isomerase